MEKYDIVIIGAGPAGLTAAMYAARANKKTAAAERLTAGGQLAVTPAVENMPGAGSTEGWEIAERMKAQATKAGAQILNGEVTEFDPENMTLKVNGETVQAGAVIIATGARSGKLGLPGEKELVGAGVSYCAVCDGAFFRGKEVALVGGSERSKTDLDYLAGLCKKVFYITGGTAETEPRSNVEIIERAAVTALEGNPLEAVVVERDGKKREIKVGGLFVDTALKPDSRLYAGKIDTDASGFIVTDELMRTSKPHVYAAGDVRAKTLRQVVTAAGDGAIAATTAVKELKNRDKK